MGIQLNTVQGQLDYIKDDPTMIQYIDDPFPEVQLNAVQRDMCCIMYIIPVCDEVIQYIKNKIG